MVILADWVSREESMMEMGDIEAKLLDAWERRIGGYAITGQVVMSDGMQDAYTMERRVQRLAPQISAVASTPSEVDALIKAIFERLQVVPSEGAVSDHHASDYGEPITLWEVNWSAIETLAKDATALRGLIAE